MAKKGLGRGLDALLADNTTDFGSGGNGVTVMRISDIEPNRGQVRKTFDDDSLAELAASVSEHGLIQPIVVRPHKNGFYEIIAGERRWRACKLAGLAEVPVIIRETDDKAASLIAMVENLQRENLNPVEEAMGYKNLMGSYGLTQEETAEKVGKSRSAVANMMRILALPEDILIMVKDGELSGGHARALLPLVGKVPDAQITGAAKKIAAEGLSVRITEKLVKTMLAPPPEKPSKVSTDYYRRVEARASSKLGRHLHIHQTSSGKGSVSLSFSCADDLDLLLRKLCGNTFFEENE